MIVGKTTRHPYVQAFYKTTSLYLKTSALRKTRQSLGTVMDLKEHQQKLDTKLNATGNPPLDCGPGKKINLL